MHKQKMDVSNKNVLFIFYRWFWVGQPEIAGANFYLILVSRIISLF